MLYISDKESIANASNFIQNWWVTPACIFIRWFHGRGEVGPQMVYPGIVCGIESSIFLMSKASVGSPWAVRWHSKLGCVMPGFRFGKQGGINSFLPFAVHICSEPTVDKMPVGTQNQFLLAMSVIALKALRKWALSTALCFPDHRLELADQNFWFSSWMFS